MADVFRVVNLIRRIEPTGESLRTLSCWEIIRIERIIDMLALATANPTFRLFELFGGDPKSGCAFWALGKHDDQLLLTSQQHPSIAL